ncbi:Protein kinase domain-containing protein [Psidium guajava]|nr:Protein kinase domain-containing protein [Psidium guajava]
MFPVLDTRNRQSTEEFALKKFPSCAGRIILRTDRRYFQPLNSPSVPVLGLKSEVGQSDLTMERKSVRLMQTRFLSLEKQTPFVRSPPGSGREK